MYHDKPTTHELNPSIYRILHTLKNFAVHPKISQEFSSEIPLKIFGLILLNIQLY